MSTPSYLSTTNFRGAAAAELNKAKEIFNRNTNMFQLSKAKKNKKLQTQHRQYFHIKTNRMVYSKAKRSNIFNAFSYFFSS